MFVSLAIQHVMRMSHIILSSVWFCHIAPHYLTNGTIFGGKKLLSIKRVLIFSTNSVSKISPRRTERDMNTNVHVKQQLFLSDFNET